MDLYYVKEKIIDIAVKCFSFIISMATLILCQIMIAGLILIESFFLLGAIRGDCNFCFLPGTRYIAIVLVLLEIVITIIMYILAIKAIWPLFITVFHDPFLSFP